MTVCNSFNKTVHGTRQIVLDTELTGLENPRLVSIGLLEMINGNLTGRHMHKIVNPEMTMSDEVIAIHHITNEFAQQQPVFAAYAKEVRDFIGDSQIIITCRTMNNITLDISVVNTEMEKVGQHEIPEEQWLNVRRWSEEMFGNNGARLDAVLDRYGISRAQRELEGHGALLDAQLLAAVYPKLRDDYATFTKKSSQNTGVLLTHKTV